jgi:hypothetical protein
LPRPALRHHLLHLSDYSWVISPVTAAKTPRNNFPPIQISGTKQTDMKNNRYVLTIIAYQAFNEWYNFSWNIKVYIDNYTVTKTHSCFQ